MIGSPFKFLDPFTLADKDVFFGRDKEKRLLYRQVQRTRLLILYGLSGTGKTSLVQCGLASEFNGPDWLPIWVRHQTNINESLQTAIRQELPEAEGSISIQIRRLYQHFLRPVYLIFDQFEELFILGTPEERDVFIAGLKTIIEEELPCTILIIIREEYLGRLYPFEKAIPHLFEFRLRVEPMDYENVKTVLRESFRKFNISAKEIEGESSEARLDEIIKNVSLERSGIELPYLQVYLDQLYREDFQRTYPEQAVQDGKNWPPIEFTKQEISDFGTIDKVLNKYLDEQLLRIQTRLLDDAPDTPTDTVKAVLDGFVSNEETKRPIRYKREGKTIEPEASQRVYFPKLTDEALSICLEELEKAKLLRFEPETIELAHDSLAKIIYGWRTDEQRERDNFKNQIRLAAASFEKTGEYLTRKQLAKFEDVLILLDKEEAQFFRNSKQAREEEEKKTLQKEIQRSNELGKALVDKHAAKIEAEKQVLIAQENTQKAEHEVRGLRIALERVKKIIEFADKNAEFQIELAQENARKNLSNNNKIKFLIVISIVILIFAGYTWCSKESEIAKNQRFTNAFYFNNGSFALSLKKNAGDGEEDLYGFIDKNANIYIDYLYNEATSFDYYDGYARVKRSEQKYLLDTLRSEYPLAQNINELNDEKTSLDLHNKQLNSIPFTVFNYPKLEILLLYKNQIEELPIQIKNLINLQHLDLSDNFGIKKLPNELWTLTSLRILNLRSTSLNKVSAQIGNLSQLQSLDLSYNNLLDNLPKQIGILKNLQNLNLSNSLSLKSLPKEISRLKNLRTLNLHDTSIPHEEISKIKSWLPNCQIIY